MLLQNFGTPDVVYQPISPYPSVKRDLSLILDRSVDYGKLEEIAFKYGGSKLKKVTLFDVYEGANLGMIRNLMPLILFFRMKVKL